ncbi:MAG: type II toxin-antitoxin system PemK/MazF family toxin [Candidatus Omnitrophica bacterium]|nr:type II toxin-antitoxin system PemK/MazF family toxin [Candidatus Omnitrophota bacterium]
MQRGEVWWAQLPKPAGRRPVLILSRDKAIQVRQHITIAEITRTVRNIPVEVALGLSDGLPQSCVVNLDVVNTIPKQILVKCITILGLSQMEKVETALKFALDLQ